MGAVDIGQGTAYVHASKTFLRKAQLLLRRSHLTETTSRFLIAGQSRHTRVIPILKSGFIRNMSLKRHGNHISRIA